MKLAIDAMSGDFGSEIVVDACLAFLKKNKKDELYVVGKAEELKQLEGNSQITIVDAQEVLDMNASVLAIRRKKESSMVKAMMLAREDKVDAVLSCGNTGAYYASAMLFLKRIEGVEKSCLMATMPTYTGKGVQVLDVGANSENTAKQLVSFAVMGNIYAKNVKNIKNPKIGLLNIGTEEKKGDEVHQETFKLLKELEGINFIGNIEGRDILLGDVDVVVSDGFSGNIALKTIEGTAQVLMKVLKESLMSSTSGKIGALLAKKSLNTMKGRFDHKAVGGALMIGFVKPVIKAHGSSDAVAFENAINLAFDMVKSEVIEKMKVGLK